MYRPPTGPSWLIIASLNDDRGGFDSFWPRLEEVDVLTPETELVPLEETTPPEWDSGRIRRIMTKRRWDRAFVRTGQKAAPGDLEKGSLIHEATEREIDRTLESLFAQIERSEWEHGDTIVLRERLDLQFCLNPNHWMCHPEVRFFVEGGDVLFAVSDRIGPESVCAQRYRYLTSMLDEATLPVEEASRVAEAFDELTWAVDFVLDTGGDWYCVELNLNGVRWSEEAEDWINMCGHGEMESHGPRIVHGPVFDRRSDLWNG